MKYYRVGGSPPRVWGQRAPVPLAREWGRFTPTRVGTTPTAPRTASGTPVHPHACGDNAGGDEERWSSAGSPPRVWGQPVPSAVEPAGRRFTPTRVGTTARRAARATPPAVHPHACGDNVDAILSDAPPLGSPPRVWG